MRLIRVPVIPTSEQVRRPLTERLRRKIGNKPPKSWETFLGKMVTEMYWNVELRK
jgi:hypothetical protein